MADNRDEFSEKVLAKLKEKNRAIDLTEEEIVESAKPEPEIIAQSEPTPDQNFVAFDATGAAPTSGGNKDILIIPGFGGTTAASASQINFYWIEPATVPTDNVTDATGTTRRSTLFNYSDDLNNPAIAFGGYNGTLNLAPASTYGGSTTNTVAKIWIHPFSGTIDADYLDLGNNTVTAATTAGILSWVPGSTRLSVGDGTNAKQIAYTTDVTSANSITATLDTTDTDLFPLFVNLVGDGTSNQTVKTGGTATSMLMNATNGNITIQGDLAINGGDLTSTATTFNMLTSTSTTVSAFTAATSLTLGATTGTGTIRNATIDLPNATTISGSSGLATVFSSANPSSLAVFGAATTATAYASATSLTLGATSGTGTIRNATIDFPNATTISGSSGLATVFSSANPSSLAVFGAATTATAYASATSLTLGATSGTGTIRNATISFPNATTISGSSGLATVFSSANPSSLTVFGAATTATIFGAATTLGIGSSTGTASINNTTVSFPNATTISGSSALASVFATANPSSLAVFGAATTFSLGSSTGTASINNTTVSFPNATTISGSSALASVFATANPSSLAVFGAATTFSLGSSTGTASINNTTVSFPNATTISGSSALATVFSAANPSSLAVFGAATTATIFGAATSLTMGATSGTGTIRNATIDFPNATTISGSSGLATVFSSANPSSLAVFGAATTATILGAATSLTLGAASGTGTIRNATIDFPNATTISGSSGLATVFSSANPSSLAVFGAATTATILGAASALTIGQTSGTATIRNTTISFTNATNITATSGTLALFAEATTVTEFAAATNVTMFGTTGTATFNIGAGSSASGATKTVNIGTGGVATSTTNITIGATSNTSNSTISFAGNRIQNVATPTAATDAANKQYVDSARAGIDVHESARCIGTSQLAANYVQTEAAGSTTAITATITFTSNGAQSFDGVTPTSGQSVLITGGISGSVTANSLTISNGSDTNKFTANGIYTVTREGTVGTTCVLTRRTDTDDNLELEGGTFTFIQEGTNYADSAWICTNDTATNAITFAPSTGTTGVITFVQFSGAGQITAGAGLTKSGNTIDVGQGTGITVNADSIQISATYVGQTSINTLGTVTTGTWNATTIALAYGGLGTTQFTQNGVLYGNAATSILVTAQSAAAGAILQTTTSGGAPTFATTLRGDYTFGTTASGSLTIDSPSIVTNTSNLTLFGTNATTLTAFGAATTLGIGSSAGTMQLRNATVDFTNATTISGNAALATVFSSANPSSLAVFGAATTATIFGSATSLTMGAASGTGTIRNATIDFPNATTISGSSGLATVFSSANPSSLSVFGAATTATAYASATSLTLGATSGTGTIRNATISFPNATTISGSSGLATVFSSANPSSLAVFGAATTATIFGSATTLGIGSSTGTASINNTTVSFPNATTISGSSALASVFATANPSSLAVFGAATTFSLGSSTGTASINNTTVSFPNATVVSGSSALATVFSSANPSSLAVFGSATTATILGAATTLSIGSTAGAVTIANATATFSGTTANFSANTAFNLGTSVTGASTLNIGTGAVAGAIKAINIGTGGSGTGTSTIIIGTTSGTSTITLNGVTSLSTALAVGSGGTGTSSAPTQWGVIFATSTSAYNSTAAGTNNQWLRAVTSGAPTWSTATLATTYTQYDLVYASASNAVTGLANTSTSVLVSQTAGPVWLQGATGNRLLKTNGSAISWSQVDLASGDVTGTLAVGSGGTGLTSYTVDGIVYATGSTTLASSSNFKFNASTTSGSVTTSAHYVNTAVTTGTAMHLAAASMTSGNAFFINAGNGSFTSGKLIDAQNNSVSKFSVDFNGNLRATTKSFDIEHPTKPGKRLVYGVLEGPEHGVYHRGTVEGKGLLKIELPEYWHKLVGEDYSIQLTPWGNYAVHIIEKTENYFIIQLSGNFISQKFKNIKVDYIIHGSRIDAPLEIEQD
jgi:hypothetical protein